MANANAILDVTADPRELAHYLAETGRGDGLPVVPPTLARVSQMLTSVSTDPDAELGYLAPSYGLVSPRYIAINAVLAGCAPDHMPILLSAVSALLDPAFNTYALQPTTNPAAPLMIVHGPVASEIGMNSGTGCFGPGNYANAVLGRALRLVLQNLGGGVPGETDLATHGWPGKYTFCAAENTQGTPWATFQTRRGFAPEDSAVSLFAVQAQHNIADVTGRNGYEVLNVIGHGMAAPGTNNHTLGGEALIILAPEQAAQVAASGITYDEARQILFEYARIDMTRMPEPFRRLIRVRRPEWCDLTRLPVTDRWDDIHVIVAGGEGVHALYMAGFGTTRSVTQRVQRG